MRDLQFIITINGVPITLQHAPDGWDDALIQTERSMTYYGMFRSFSIPLKFVKDGAKILRQAFYYFNGEIEQASSYEAKVTILINKLNKISLVYEQLFTGEFDFSTFKDTLDYVEINIIDGGLTSIIKAKASQIVELPLPTDQVINYDGIVLDSEDVILSGIQHHNQESLPFTQSAPFDVLTFENLTQNAIEVQNSGHELSPSDTDWFILAHRKCFLNAEINVTATFHCQNLAYESESATIDVTVVLRVQDSLIHTDYEIGSFSTIINSSTPYGIKNIAFNHTRTLQNIKNSIAGDTELHSYTYISVLAICTATNESSGIAIDFTDCTFTGNLFASLPPIQFRVFPIYDLIRALLAEIAPGYEFVSTYYDFNASPNTLTLWTCGSAIRNQKVLYVTENGVISKTYIIQALKISLENLFKTIDIINPMGMGVEVINGVEVLRIEQRGYFFNQNASLQIGGIRDFKLSVSADLIYNQVKVGWPNQDYGEDAGRNEVNSTQVYSIPVTRIVKELDLVSPYRADFYGIDYYRLKFAADDTKDDEGDNQIFVLSGTPAFGHSWQWELLRAPFLEENGGSITGIIFPRTAYNLMLTPGHCMKRHNAWFSSLCHHNIGYIKFLSSEKNARGVMTYTDEDYYILEDDIGINVLDTNLKYFQPYYFELVSNLSAVNLDYLMKSYKPGDLVEFLWKGKTFSGFLMDTKLKLSGRAECSMKLLAALGTDLGQLVDPPAYTTITVTKYVENNTEDNTEFYFNLIALTEGNPSYNGIAVSASTPYVFENIASGDYQISEVPNDLYTLSHIYPSTFSINGENANQIVEIVNNKKLGYGAMYNGYAMINPLIAPSGWHVPTIAEFKTLVSWLINHGYGYEGSGNDIAKSMASNAGWIFSDVAGSIGNDQSSNNSSGLNMKPAGYRNIDGTFANMGQLVFPWTTSPISAQFFTIGLVYYSFQVENSAFNLNHGSPIILIKDDSENTETVIDYDGNIYPTAKFGNQVWMCKYLKTTHLNDGTLITDITENSDWEALTSGAMCYYQNNLNNS